MANNEQYKDSGIDWVGIVPASWNRSRIKFLLSHSSAGVWGEDEKGNKDDIVCFRAADFDYSHGCLKLDNNTVRNIQQKQLEGRVLHKRDLLIEKSGGGDATPVGRIVRFNYDGIATCSNFMHFISVNKCNDDNYLFYYFYAMYANNVNVLYFNQTTGIQNLKVSEYLGQTIFLPSLKEQTTIANYLDKKCSEIDNVISAQQKRIALLQELKQSVITHAVTKGLNPNVEMKDSGMEWIGDIPCNWNNLRLRFVCELRNGYTPSKANPEFWEDGIIPWYRMEDIRECGRKLKEAKQYITEDAVKGGGLFEAGSFILATTATIGEHAVLIVDSLANQRFTNLKIRKSLSQKLLGDFFFYYLYMVDDYCKATTKTSTFPAVSMELLKNCHIVFPSVKEQYKIIDYLDKRCASIDSSISKAQHQVELLQEYKQSLITEVVTGKRKVC